MLEEAEYEGKKGREKKALEKTNPNQGFVLSGFASQGDSGCK